MSRRRQPNRFYSCTTDRDGGDRSSLYGDYIIDAPLILKEIGILPAKTIVYVPLNYPHQEGTPFPVCLDQNAFGPGVALGRYFFDDDLHYIIAPPGWDRDYKCWECQPSQVTCYDDAVNGIPHPCAWWQKPFLWICSLEGLIEA